MEAKGKHLQQEVNLCIIISVKEKSEQFMFKNGG